MALHAQWGKVLEFSYMLDMCVLTWGTAEQNSLKTIRRVHEGGSLAFVLL